tara:strand:+ start:3285 stop:3386 length:102 start_codon:yes stop_codon:yes gene_type:complete
MKFCTLDKKLKLRIGFAYLRLKAAASTARAQTG